MKPDTKITTVKDFLDWLRIAYDNADTIPKATYYTVAYEYMRFCLKVHWDLRAPIIFQYSGILLTGLLIRYLDDNIDAEAIIAELVDCKVDPDSMPLMFEDSPTFDDKQITPEKLADVCKIIQFPQHK